LQEVRLELNCREWKHDITWIHAPHASTRAHDGTIATTFFFLQVREQRWMQNWCGRGAVAVYVGHTRIPTTWPVRPDMRGAQEIQAAPMRFRHVRADLRGWPCQQSCISSRFKARLFCSCARIARTADIHVCLVVAKRCYSKSLETIYDRANSELSGHSEPSTPWRPHVSCD
jgi:hypothetical protein